MLFLVLFRIEYFLDDRNVIAEIVSQLLYYLYFLQLWEALAFEGRTEDGAREIPKLVLRAWPVILSAKGLRVSMICWVQIYRTQEDYHGESSVHVSIHTYREGTTVLSWKGFPLQAVWRQKPK